MTFGELQAFLREAQKDPRAEDPAYVGNLFKDFAKAPRYRDPRQPSLTLPEVGVANTINVVRTVVLLLSLFTLLDQLCTVIWAQLTLRSHWSSSPSHGLYYSSVSILNCFFLGGGIASRAPHFKGINCYM